MAAKRGDPGSQFAIAVMHVNGDGVERDQKEAARWFKKAAQNGHPTAAKYLARLQNKNLSTIKTVRLEMIKYRQAVAETSELGHKVRYIHPKPGQSLREIMESIDQKSGGIVKIMINGQEFWRK